MASSVANSTYVLTPNDWEQLNSFCLWTGFSAPNFWDVITGEVVLLVTDFLVANFNDTSGQSNATTEDIAAYLGGSVESSSDFINGILAGTTNATEDMYEVVTNLLPYATHPVNSPAVIPLFAVFTILTSAVLAIRLYSRQKLTGKIHLFDWIAVLGFLITVALGAVAVAHSHYSGRYASFCDRTWAQIRMTSMLYYVELAIYPMAILVIKSSFLLFYYHLSQWKALRWGVIATFGLTFGNAMAAFFAWFFQCSVIDSWNVKFNIVCPVNMLTLTLSTGAINIITDLLIWAIPLPLLYKLQLYPRERILAIFTFGLGFIACIASIFRLVALKEHVMYSGTSTSTVAISVWTIIELNLALICASTPAIRALFIAYAPKILSSYGSNRSGSGISSNGNSTRIATPSRARAIPIHTPSHNSFDEKHEEKIWSEVPVENRI